MINKGWPDLQGNDWVLRWACHCGPAARINRVLIPALKSIMWILQRGFYVHQSLHWNRKATSRERSIPLHRRIGGEEKEMLPSKLTPLGEREAAAQAQDQKKAIQKTIALPFFAPMELTASPGHQNKENTACEWFWSLQGDASMESVHQVIDELLFLTFTSVCFLAPAIRRRKSRQPSSRLSDAGDHDKG